MVIPVCYTPQHVADMLTEFHEKLGSNLSEFLAGTDYKAIKEAKGRRVHDFISRVFTEIRHSVPDELDIDYVYCRKYTKNDKVKIVIRGVEDNIESFEFSKTFPISGEEKAITIYMTDVLDRVIENEYALYNLDIASQTVNDLLKRLNYDYRVKYTTCLNRRGLLKDISDKEVIIYSKVDKAIELGTTIYFSGLATIFDISARKETAYQLLRELEQEIAKAPTTPEYLGIQFSLHVFLTGKVKKEDVHKEIAKLYTRDIDEFGKNESGIGYRETEHTYGLVKKDKNRYNTYLTVYHKRMLCSFK